MGPSDENLVQLTRVLRAPPAEVFSAWTEPALLEQWWAGVGGWTEARVDVNLRVGGHYRFTMRDARGSVDDWAASTPTCRDPTVSASPGPGRTIRA